VNSLYLSACGNKVDEDGHAPKWRRKPLAATPPTPESHAGDDGHMGARTGGLQDTRTAATLPLGLTTLDTTRAGRLPVSGAANFSTSGYDDLARDGVVFGSASSMMPLLHVAAHRSLFIGLVPLRPGPSRTGTWLSATEQIQRRPGSTIHP